MFAVLSRGWALTKLSLGVVRQDKELLVLPILSSIGLAIATALAFGGLAMLESTAGLSDGTATAVLLLLYLVVFFIQIYFNTGIVAAARIRLDGGDPTLGDAFKASNSNLGRIFGWSIVAATVGILLALLQRYMREHGGLLGHLFGSFLSMGWNLATYFVLPVLVHERLGPIEAIKRSAMTFKNTWGETVVGGFGIGLVFILFGLIALPVLYLALVMPLPLPLTIGLLGLVVVYWLVLWVVSATAKQVLVAALYRFATEGHTGGVMDDQAAAHVFQADWRQYTDPSTGRIRGA